MPVQFKSYDEIITAELAAGHDMVLASCFNFASKDEEEDGVAMYIGQGDDIGDRCVLCIDRNGWATLILSNGQVVASNFDLKERPDLIANISWLVSLD
jgi:hypothetical protein